MRLAVCGLHLRGQVLNSQLTDLGATFVSECMSAPVYRFFAFTDSNGKTKPGMIRPYTKDGCASIAMEIWDMPQEKFGSFISLVPPPLGIGSVELDNGSYVHGFICESWVMEAALAGDSSCKEITHHGSWTRFMEHST